MNEEWIEEYMKLLAKHEGTRAAKAIEGGGYTRGYGLTSLAENFIKSLSETRGVSADELSDKELAKEYVIWNAEQIKRKFPNFDEWPTSVKMSAVDIQYNGGNISKYKGFSSALSAGNYEEAAKQTLDIVSANDPQTGQMGVLRGLANRRVDFYNMVANEVGFSPIKDFSITRSGVEGKKTNINYDKGDSVIDFDFRGALHSASGDYDSVKKKRFKQPTAEDIRRETSPFMEENRRYNQRLTGDVLLPDDFDTQTATEEVVEPAVEEEIAQPPVEEETAPEAMPEAQTASEPDVLPEPEPEAAIEPTIPMPEPGSFDALFKPSMIGVEDSFAVPDNFTLSEEQEKTRQSEKEIEERVINQRFPKTNLYRDLHERMYGFDNNRFGERVPSKIDENAYDYHLYTPTIGQAFMSAMRQYHVGPSLGRLINSSIDPTMRSVEGYDPFKDRELKRLVGEDGLFFFRHVGSHNQAMEKYRRMQEDRNDMEILSYSDYGTPLTIGVSLATPTVLAPIAPIRIMRAGPVRRFFGGAAFTYMMTAGQQGIIETQNEARDASHTAMGLAAASILGGTLAVAFGKNMSTAHMAEMQATDEYLRTGKSAGAAVNPETARTTMYRQLEQEGLEETGIEIEKLGWNPVLRMLSSSNPFVRNMAVGLVDVGGMMQKKVRSFGIEMDQSVEATWRVNYLPKLLDSIRKQDEAYLRYRNAVPESGDGARAWQMLKMQAVDTFWMMPNNVLTEVQFRQRVGMAMIRGDVDNVGDLASAHVTAAAQAYRPLMNYIKEQAQEVGLFTEQLRREIEIAYRTGDTELVRKLQDELSRVQEMGVNINTAQSYLPRIWRLDKIDENTPRFLEIVRTWLRTQGETVESAERISLEILDNITRRKPYIDLEGTSDYFDFIKNASGAQRRTFEIPDELVEEFLERDVEAVIRHHTQTMGMDIELARRYGSFDLKTQIDEVANEYDRLIDEAVDFETRSKLAKDKKRDLEDLMGLRDRLRGTYGASKDPHTLASRAVRVMKSFNVLTGMGSAMISSVPDIARLVMVEGLSNAYHRGFKTLFNEQASLIRDMAKPELDKAAVSIDAVLGMRARAMSDMGDLFGSRYQIERSLNSASGMYMFINGMNIWNQVLKEISGNITMLRMTESIMKQGGWSRLTRTEKEKLLKNGIGQNDYQIMRREIRRNGERRGNEWLPNTEGWSDAGQRLKFRIALNQNVERTIITPGAGDRALWTSTEVGSLMTQFKSYGQASMVRMLTAGLQEKDAAFWQGAFLLVGLAGMVNEMKRVQYGITSDESADQKLLNAIDRSGILGWFMDVNNSIEKVSDYKLGMRPFLTDKNSYPVHANAKISSIFGPSASAILNGSEVLGDVLGNEVDSQTAKNLRFIFPTGNLWYLDPVLDGMFGEGNVNRQTISNRE